MLGNLAHYDGQLLEIIQMDEMGQLKESVRFLHHAKRLHCGGGMEAVMRSHLRESGRQAFFVSFLLGDEKDTARQVCLDGAPHQTIGGLRRLYADKVHTRLGAEASLYHNCWGLDLWADLDPAEFRIGFIHSSYPRVEKFIRYYARFADGFIFVNEEMMAMTRQILPHWDESRLAYFPHIIKAPDWIGRQGCQLRQKVVIGFAGRLVKKQKRIDRIPSFLEILDQKLPGAIFEILAAGPDENWLREALAERENVHFHGWKEGDDYWKILNRWKFMVFFSDYEGLPIALLEALAGGVVPLYPDFYGGRDFLARMDPTLLYRPGNIESLLQTLCAANDWSSQRQEQFFEKSQKMMAGMQMDSLESRYDQFLSGLAKVLPITDRYRKSVSLMKSMTPIWAHNRWERRLF